MSEKLVPERLRTARENLGITMAEASRRLNLSKIGYCRYEYGDRVPSMQTVEVIAQCFHTSVDYLIGLSDDPDPTKIVVSKDKDPVLFEIVQFYQEGDVEQRERLSAYFKKLTK